MSDKGELEERMPLDSPGDELCAVGGTRNREEGMGTNGDLSLLFIQIPVALCTLYLCTSRN